MSESPGVVPESPFLVPFDGSFRLDEAPTEPPGKTSKKDEKDRLERAVDALDDLQRQFYAHDHHALLLVFQAMDAAGKDSTIRAVLRGVDPAGCQVFSFKKPSAEELDHDFLWRHVRDLPERGRIGVFNRSWYEEVLVVRVHPEFLDGQNLPHRPGLPALWEERYESINDLERHLVRNGTIVLKFFLNVSKEEQRRRFLRRLRRPDKHWKFSVHDVVERSHWDAYQDAYESALRATSTPWAPWYSIPADDKPFMRATVAEIIVDALSSLKMSWPQPSGADRDRHDEMRRRLLEEGSDLDPEDDEEA